MPKTLTTEHFDEVITGFKAHVDERFDTVEKRLDAIEKMLWQGERLRALEDRTRELAERTGNADLATPIPKPL